MNTGNRVLGSFLLLTVFSINVASASLLSVDDPSLGIGKITRDTSSNLEWLDMDVTANLTWNQAESLYSSYGFTHATVSQVENLFVGGGFLGIDAGTSPIDYLASVELQDLITCIPGFDSETKSSTCLSSGYTALDTLGRTELSWINRNDTLGVSTVIANSNNFIGGSSLDTYHHATLSHWMVRSSQIPEPHTIVLVLFGLMALAYTKRAHNENSSNEFF